LWRLLAALGVLATLVGATAPQVAGENLRDGPRPPEAEVRSYSMVSSARTYRVTAQTGRVPTLYYWAYNRSRGLGQFWAAKTDGSHRRLLWSEGRGVNGGFKLNRNGGWTPCCSRIYVPIYKWASETSTGMGQIGVDGSRLVRFRHMGPTVSQRSGRSVRSDLDGGVTVTERNGTGRQIWSVDQVGLPWNPESSLGVTDAAISPSGTSVAAVFGVDKYWWLDSNWENVFRGSSLYVMSSSGTDSHLVYFAPGRGSPEELDFSSQGGKILFTHDFTCDEYYPEGSDDYVTNCPGDWDDYNESDDIYLANTLGFGARRITNTMVTDESEPTFNPEATKIAFTTEQSGDVYIVPAAGGRPRHFAHLRLGPITPYVWLNTRWQRRKRIRR
jgi:hypothetical protein